MKQSAVTETGPRKPVVEQVARKLQTLSPERLAEVEDFIDFLHHRDEDRQLMRWAMAATEPVLNAVWDNPDDAGYDQL